MRASHRREEGQELRVVALALAVALGLGLGLGLGTARAQSAEDIEARADAAFRAATQRSASDPAGALAAFEALGAERPVTRWTDNAWEQAAQLAEAAGDYARARANLERAIADSSDAHLVRRAKATLARIAATTGGGQWDAVAREHERLRSAITAGGDPHAALRELAALVRAHPDYPRATAIRVAIALTHEVEGEDDDALAWMREAVANAGDERGRVTALQLVRMLIRMRELDAARSELARLASEEAVDRGARDEATRLLARAERRTWIRRGVALLLALLVAGALLVVRRGHGRWASALRALSRPPTEVFVVAPFAAMLAVLAMTGNPLVARAVIVIALGGSALAWLSGSVAGARRAGARLPMTAHVTGVAAAVSSLAYLAVENGVLDLLLETWHGGHALP